MGPFYPLSLPRSGGGAVWEWTAPALLTIELVLRNSAGLNYAIRSTTIQYAVVLQLPGIGHTLVCLLTQRVWTTISK